MTTTSENTAVLPIIPSSPIPLVFVEVTPVVYLNNTDNSLDRESTALPQLSNFGVKEYLRRCSEEYATTSLLESMLGCSSHNERQGLLCIQWTINKDIKNEIKIIPGSINSKHGSMLKSGHLRMINLQSQMIVDQRTNHPLISMGFPIVHVPSQDPTCLQPHPCVMKAYVSIATNNSNLKRNYYRNPSLFPVLITAATLIRILPPSLCTENPTTTSTGTNFTMQPDLAGDTISARFLQQMILQYQLSGEIGNDILSDTLQEQVLLCHHPDTIQQLEWKLAYILQQPIRIGTTPTALSRQTYQTQQLQRMTSMIRSYREVHQQHDQPLPPPVTVGLDEIVPPSEQQHGRLRRSWWPSLLVHSPHNGDGKTLLVQAIAHQRLNCQRIHMIRPAVLLAKYGSLADAALESQLHAILISAACADQSVCVLLDPVDMLLPPSYSARSGTGDAAVPVLMAMASYLRQVTTSLQQRKEFPFPVKNPLYNPSCTKDCGSSCDGCVLTVRCCIVGVVTCPDDGWKTLLRKSSEGILQGTTTILNCMGVSDRFRLPVLTAETRWKAFQAAFQRVDVVLDDLAARQLPKLAAAAAWAKGRAFERVARRLKQRIVTSKQCQVTLDELYRTFLTIQNEASEFATVEFETTDAIRSSDDPVGFSSSLDATEEESSYFVSIGGNAQAKASLEDALALDPLKRSLLAKFGMSPPVGVLLYGPPGCGKTLLAKAVASLLKSSARANGIGVDETTKVSSSGGSFLSLAIPDIVSSELGTSEKLIRSSFEVAEQNAPAVIFLDEFQALFVDRNTGGTSKLTTTLLQCLDDLQRWQNNNVSLETIGRRVTVLAATNTPWMIDSAFLRPGRFDRVVHVGLPTLEERESILRLHIQRMRVLEEEKSTIGVLCQQLASQTDGFSGADLAALCRAAAVRAVMENADADHVTVAHFVQALETDVNQSSDSDLVLRLSMWRP